MDSNNPVNIFTSFLTQTRKYAFKLCALALFALLTGCMTPTSQSSFNANRFTAEGKIALRYPNCPQYRACEEKGVSASLDWRHEGGEDFLTFYDPLGQAQALLTYDNGTVAIQEDGQSRTTDQTTLEQELGMPMPIDALRDIVLNQQAKETFTYQGWQVEVKEWQGQFYRSVRLRQDDYYIRLIIYHIE